MAVRPALTLLFLCLLAGVAQARPTVPRAACMMTALAPTHAVENPQATLARGATWGPATQMRIARADGRVSYCAHGDYCYPAERLRFTTPCTPDATPMPATAGDSERLYGLRGPSGR